ncbi:MFS transporter [Candidatus Bathyarchaeota archaeon]|nr:MFS transporter [Candidatus Bathyarchaeota archaeon]
MYSSSLYYLLRRSGSNRGRVTGSFESILGLGYLLGPLLGGAVAQFQGSYLFIVGAGLSLLVLVLQILFWRRTVIALKYIKDDD